MIRHSFAFLGLLVLAGCVSTTASPVTEAQHAAVTDRFNGDFLWNCAMSTEDGSQTWRFIIREERVRGFARHDLLDATQTRPEPVRLTQWNSAQIFELSDGSVVQIASDGEARGEGRNATRGQTFPTGMCQRGNA